MFVIVSYDITDDKRRNRVAKVMRAFGDRVQYSVFECNLEEKELPEMLKKVKRAIVEKEDSVRVYKMCKACASELTILGLGTPTEDPDLVIV